MERLPMQPCVFS